MGASIVDFFTKGHWVQGVLANAEKEGNLEEEKLTFSERLPSIFKKSSFHNQRCFLVHHHRNRNWSDDAWFYSNRIFEQYISKKNPFAVPFAVILGIPMYSNAAGVLPIIQVFVQKGIPIGTAIAFMMAVVGLSIPKATMLKKVMTWKLIAIFFGVVAFFIIISGYLFNIIL